MQTDLPPFANRLKERRSAYGISQNKLAVAAGMARSYISDIETGKVLLTKDKEDMLLESLERYNPDAQLTMLFDYVRIRFPTTDVRYVTVIVHAVTDGNLVITKSPTLPVFLQNPLMNQR